MFGNLDIFQMAQGLARYSGARQAVISQNIANADTPGYRAQDLDAFAATYQAGHRPAMRGARAGHDMGVMAASFDASAARVARPGAESPNGNTVSLEQEMLVATRVKGDHDRALAIYKSALTIMRSSINGGR